MEKRQFGKTDMQVSALGFGGAEIGFLGTPPATVETLLKSALDAGLNVIDTAECYMNSEELIGAAVSDRRDDYHLFTKCGHFEPGQADWRPESLLESITRSLKRLRTDRVDLVQLHSCTLETLRQGDVIEALRTARDKGYTRYIGYSGDRGAARYAVESGVFDALQTSFSVADQEAADLSLPLARQRQMGVIAKRPIANAVWRNKQRPEEPYHQPYWDRLQHLEYDFLDGPLDKSIGMALRFTVFQPGIHTAIVGTTQPGRWQENAAHVARGPLPPVEIEAIHHRWAHAAKEDWEGQT